MQSIWKLFKKCLSRTNTTQKVTSYTRFKEYALLQEDCAQHPALKNCLSNNRITSIKQLIDAIQKETGPQNSADTLCNLSCLLYKWLYNQHYVTILPRVCNTKIDIAKRKEAIILFNDLIYEINNQNIKPDEQICYSLTSLVAILNFKTSCECFQDIQSSIVHFINNIVQSYGERKISYNAEYLQSQNCLMTHNTVKDFIIKMILSLSDVGKENIAQHLFDAVIEYFDNKNNPIIIDVNQDNSNVAYKTNFWRTLVSTTNASQDYYRLDKNLKYHAL